MSGPFATGSNRVGGSDRDRVNACHTLTLAVRLNSSVHSELPAASAAAIAASYFRSLRNAIPTVRYSTWIHRSFTGKTFRNVPPNIISGQTGCRRAVVSSHRLEVATVGAIDRDVQPISIHGFYWVVEGFHEEPPSAVTVAAGPDPL